MTRESRAAEPVDIVEWTRQSCAAQGLKLEIENPEILRRLADVLFNNTDVVKRRNGGGDA